VSRFGGETGSCDVSDKRQTANINRNETYDCLFDIDGISFGILVGDDIARDFVPYCETLRDRRLATDDVKQANDARARSAG
jgi:hypothetical protein